MSINTLERNSSYSRAIFLAITEDPELRMYVPMKSEMIKEWFSVIPSHLLDETVQMITSVFTQYFDMFSHLCNLDAPTEDQVQTYADLLETCDDSFIKEHLEYRIGKILPSYPENLLEFRIYPKGARKTLYRLMANTKMCHLAQKTGVDSTYQFGDLLPPPQTTYEEFELLEDTCDFSKVAPLSANAFNAVVNILGKIPHSRYAFFYVCDATWSYEQFADFITHPKTRNIILQGIRDPELKALFQEKLFEMIATVREAHPLQRTIDVDLKKVVESLSDIFFSGSLPPKHFTAGRDAEIAPILIKKKTTLDVVTEPFALAILFCMASQYTPYLRHLYSSPGKAFNETKLSTHLDTYFAGNPKPLIDFILSSLPHGLTSFMRFLVARDEESPEMRLNTLQYLLVHRRFSRKVMNAVVRANGNSHILMEVLLLSHTLGSLDKALVWMATQKMRDRVQTVFAFSREVTKEPGVFALYIPPKYVNASGKWTFKMVPGENFDMFYKQCEPLARALSDTPTYTVFLEQFIRVNRPFFDRIAVNPEGDGMHATVKERTPCPRAKESMGVAYTEWVEGDPIAKNLRRLFAAMLHYSEIKCAYLAKEVTGPIPIDGISIEIPGDEGCKDLETLKSTIRKILTFLVVNDPYVNRYFKQDLTSEKAWCEFMFADLEMFILAFSSLYDKDSHGRSLYGYEKPGGLLLFQPYASFQAKGLHRAGGFGRAHKAISKNFEEGGRGYDGPAMQMGHQLRIVKDPHGRTPINIWEKYSPTFIERVFSLFHQFLPN